MHPIPDIAKIHSHRNFRVNTVGWVKIGRGRERGGGVAENAFPDGCKAQAVRAGGRVHAMMDIVLISIWPLLPYCGGAGRHRSLHPLN